jgi:HSP20 family protein
MTPDNLFHQGGGHDDLHAGFPDTVKFTDTRIKWLPPVDIYETETEVVAVVEIPGVRQEEIKVSFKNGTLIIEGVKNNLSELKGLSFFCVERSYGAFVRKFRIVSPIVKNKIEAGFDNGVLTVVLPKK